MGAIIPFAFEGREIRATDQDGEPWFVAADVCAALGISNSRDALGKLDEDEKGVALTDTLGGQQEVATLTEAGVYTLALRCRDAMKPGTAPYRFRKWVTGVALPALRRGNSPLELTPDIRRAIGGIVQDVVHTEMSAQMSGVLPSLIEREVLAGRYSVVMGVSALEVLEMAGHGRGKRPKGASQFVSCRLARYCEDRGVPVRRSRHGSASLRLFDEVTARRWLDEGGRSEIDHYIAGRKGQGALRLV